MHWTLRVLAYWVASVLIVLLTPATAMMALFMAKDPANAHILAGSFALAGLTYVPIAFAGALVAGAASITLVRALQLGSAGRGRWAAYVGAMIGMFATIVLGTVLFAPTATGATAFFLAICGGIPLLGSLLVLRTLRRRGQLPGARMDSSA